MTLFRKIKVECEINWKVWATPALIVSFEDGFAAIVILNLFIQIGRK